MKVKVFEKNKWREVDGYDFDDFLSAVVYSEFPFKFTDCTDEEVEDFVDYLNEKSTALDDGDYQNWYCEADTADMLYVFEDMHCMDLLQALKRAKKKVEEYNNCIADVFSDVEEG